MNLTAHGLEVAAPSGWEARIDRRPVPEPGATSHPVLHAATFPLPAERGDYGSGAVEEMGQDDVFVALVEFGGESVGSALFPDRPLPRVIEPEGFATNQLQRWMPGQAGQQIFFTDGGRAFCLYIVIGSFARRDELATRAEEIIARIVIESAFPPGIV